MQATITARVGSDEAQTDIAMEGGVMKGISMGIYNDLRDKIHEAFEFLGSQNLPIDSVQIQLGPDRLNDLKMGMGSDYYHLRPDPDRRDCYDFRGIPLIVVGERGACRVVSDVEKMIQGRHERPVFTTP